MMWCDEVEKGSGVRGPCAGFPIWGVSYESYKNFKNWQCYVGTCIWMCFLSRIKFVNTNEFK